MKIGLHPGEMGETHDGLVTKMIDVLLEHMILKVVFHPIPSMDPVLQGPIRLKQQKDVQVLRGVLTLAKLFHSGPHAL